MSSTLSPTDTLTSVLAPLPHSRKRRAKKSRETRKKTQPVPSDLLDQLSQHEAKEIANREGGKAESGDVVKEEVVKEDVVKEEVVKEDVVKEEVVKEDVVKEEVVKEEVVKEEVERERQEFVLQLTTDRQHTQPATAKESPPKQSAYRPNVRPPPRFRPPGATPSQNMLWGLPSGDDSAQGEGGASGWGHWVEHLYMYVHVPDIIHVVWQCTSIYVSVCVPFRLQPLRHRLALRRLRIYNQTSESIFPSVPSCLSLVLSSCPSVHTCSPITCLYCCCCHRDVDSGEGRDGEEEGSGKLHPRTKSAVRRKPREQRKSTGIVQFDVSVGRNALLHPLV